MSIPEKTTYLSQPLDNKVFGAMKSTHKSYLQRRIASEVLTRFNTEINQMEELVLSPP